MDNINVKQIKTNSMFKVNKNDVFAKNMSSRELYLLWKKLSKKSIKNK